MDTNLKNKMEQKVALFIPTYNSEKNIVEVLEQIPDDFYLSVAVIYIFDNASSDRTVEVIEKYVCDNKKSKIIIFKNSKNYLLGGSTILAFSQAIEDKIDYLICLHSDGQADPVFLNKFKSYINDDYDFILGSRFLKVSQVKEYSRLRFLFNIFFVYLQWLVIRQKVYDLGAFVGFRINTIKELPYNSIDADMGYHPYLIMVSCYLSPRKLKFKEFPISWGKVETSHVSIFKYGLIHLKRIILLLLGIVSEKTKSYESTAVYGDLKNKKIRVY